MFLNDAKEKWIKNNESHEAKKPKNEEEKHTVSHARHKKISGINAVLLAINCVQYCVELETKELTSVTWTTFIQELVFLVYEFARVCIGACHQLNSTPRQYVWKFSLR